MIHVRKRLGIWIGLLANICSSITAQIFTNKTVSTFRITIYMYKKENISRVSSNSNNTSESEIWPKIEE